MNPIQVMIDFHADLHCHSTYSDGSDTPEQLLMLAKKLNLKGLSITDHDTIAAYNEIIPLAKTLDFPLLSGVEFSASYKDEPVHVLAYGFPLDSPRIHDFCKRHTKRREHRNARMLEKLCKLGFPMTLEELYTEHTGTIGRPHIGLLLMKKGIVADLKEAFQRFLGEGKPAYDPGEKITVEETIACIQQAKGKAILAHPHLLKRSTTIRALLAMPFDGIEGYYAKIPCEKEKRWIDVGLKKGWIITGGSDYHGLVKPQIPLGCSWVGEETFKKLYDHYCTQSSI